MLKEEDMLKIQFWEITYNQILMKFLLEWS